MCGVHVAGPVGRTLHFHSLFNDTLKSQGEEGGQGVWKCLSNTDIFYVYVRFYKVQVMQWYGSGKAQKCENRKILGVRVKVDMQKPRNKHAGKSKGENSMSLRERKSLFVGGEGRQ